MSAPGKGKSKGNSFERKVAKELSLWMFNDKDVLRRHPDSGASKQCWTGDVIPLKQLPEIWKGKFPFHIECKSGYPQHLPTFWSYAKVSTWFSKALLEGYLNNQTIVFLICQFLNKSALLITNTQLPFRLLNVVFPCIINNEQHWGYVYNYKDILELDFHKEFSYIF